MVLLVRTGFTNIGFLVVLVSLLLLRTIPPEIILRTSSFVGIKLSDCVSSEINYLLIPQNLS